MESQRNPLDCLYCTATIKHPVRLPCQHHFCQECVANLNRCHICDRTINTVDLCEDKVLNYVVESSREATETCANCDRISQPMFFCETCQQPLCSLCRETTHKAKIFCLHHIVQLEERGRLRNRPFCATHNEPFILFCLDSKSLMCIECFNSSSIERRGHFVNIDVAYKICRDKLEKIGANLRTFQHEFREQIELMSRLIFELQKNSDQLNTEIIKKCEEICNRVNTMKDRLLKKVAEEKAKKEEQISIQLSRIRNLESPVCVNLLSISIFCSYASKIDLLHCYADLHNFCRHFLSENGQMIQKVKFDCNINADFSTEFNQIVYQPMGLGASTSISNVFLDCPCPKAVVPAASSHAVDRSTRNVSRKGSCCEKTATTPTSVAIIQEVAPNNFEPIVDIASDSPTNAPTFTINGTIQFNSFQPANYEIDNFSDQRFLEQFQQITNPLRNFAQEISMISKSLMDLQKDITLRRCVINGEELMNRIACCEDAWSRLESHSHLVQKILNLFMGQHWRKEIERVQRQQQIVREKVDEMKQLQNLAQRAFRISQQLKPFATQMASLISMIDVRRCCTIVPSPMEQICQEIAQIEPNSGSRVAAIEKEEELRRLAKLEEEKAQFGQKEAVHARKNLKEVRMAQKKEHRTSLVLEMDRDRAPTNGSENGTGGAISCISSPRTNKKRQQQQQLQSRIHRNSESAISDTAAISPSFKLFASNELTASLEETSEDKITQTKPIATVAPTASSKETLVEEGSDQAENCTIMQMQIVKNNKSGEKKMAPAIPKCPTKIPPPIPSSATEEQSPSAADQPSTSSSIVSTAGASIIRQQNQNRDPALLQVREKLLESIREKVKRID